MFCPQCGVTQSEELKFCKSCGANLSAVRQAITSRVTEGKFDWSKTWVAEMLLSAEEHKKRKLERLNSLEAEEKRYNEIKGGVITSAVGLSVMIFLNIFMHGIIAGGKIPSDAAEILSRVWIAGIIPFFVGIALIINGVLVSKKLVEMAKREMQRKDTAKVLEAADKNRELPKLSSDWDESHPSPPSVTEHTTRQLMESNYGADHLSESDSVQEVRPSRTLQRD